MSADMTTRGVDELVKSMQTLSTKVQRKHIKAALRKGAKPILKRSRQLLPKSLKKNVLGVKVVRDKQRAEVSALIGARLGKVKGKRIKGANLVGFFEFGTDERFTTGKKSLPAGLRRGRIRPVGMIRRGFDERVGEAKRILGRELSSAIEKEFIGV